MKNGILDMLAKKYGTDKSSGIHDYCRKYEKYLPFERDQSLKIMEIGVLEGGSLKTWQDYFPNSQIVGIDINPYCKAYEENRIKIEIGSQTDKEFLLELSLMYGTFDMILDDGSHQNNDVIYSFEQLFKMVKSGGIYIIEDTHTSYYSEYGGGRYKKGSTIEYFKGIIDEINFFGEVLEVVNSGGKIENFVFRKDQPLIDQFMRKGYSYIGTQIESMNFLNSIIIITKR